MLHGLSETVVVIAGNLRITLQQFSGGIGDDSRLGGPGQEFFIVEVVADGKDLTGIDVVTL